MPNNTKLQLNAFNKWLSDVYEQPTDLNTLLANADFSTTEINQLNQKHLADFLQNVLDLLDSYGDPPRGIVMIWHYGLEDGEPQDFYAIGPKLGVSGERIRQLTMQRLNLYRSPERQTQLQNDFAVIGRKLLANENNN